MPVMGGNNVVLGGNLWWLFIIDTVIIAAAGYVINDICDQKADMYNKPNSSFIGDGHISQKEAWVYYALLVIVGFGLAGYIAWSIDKIPLLFIYPLVSILLFLYSWSFKKLPLIGNLVVAIFCAFVPGIILYAEWNILLDAKESSFVEVDFILHMFWSYISFAFLSTMVREIVKDIEDKEGDLLARYNTLPIRYGQRTAKFIAIAFNFILIISFMFWVFPFAGTESFLLALFLVSILVFYTMYIMYQLWGASNKRDFTACSKQLKLLMIISLFIFLCFPFIK